MHRYGGVDTGVNYDICGLISFLASVKLYVKLLFVHFKDCVTRTARSLISWTAFHC